MQPACLLQIRRLKTNTDMPCYLSLSGDNFDVDSFLAVSSISPHSIDYRGDVVRFRYPKCLLQSSCKFKVSHADFNDFRQQVQDVIAFLTEHFEELQRWRSFSINSTANLDFGVQTRMHEVWPFRQINSQQN